MSSLDVVYWDYGASQGSPLHAVEWPHLEVLRAQAIALMSNGLVALLCGELTRNCRWAGMRAACNMSAQSWVKETSIYLDVGIEIVTGLSLLLDRPLCRLKGIRVLIMRVDTSLLYMSNSVHERQRVVT